MLAQLILQFLSISIDSYHLQNLVYRYAVSNFDLIDRPARVLPRIITYSELLNFRNTLRACLVALQVSNTLYYTWIHWEEELRWKIRLQSIPKFSPQSHG